MYRITGILGLMFIFAPLVLGYSDSLAFRTTIVLGAVITAVSYYQSFADKMGKWEYWASGILGLLALLAPFVLGFDSLTPALWATLALGVSVAVLSGYEALFRRPQPH